MKIENIDLTKKENQTFKNWFKIMWGNSYIFLFVVALAAIIGIPFADFDEWYHYFIVLIPISTCVAIAYKGFYQFWNDLKNGTSR